MIHFNIKSIQNNVSSPTFIINCYNHKNRTLASPGLTLCQDVTVNKNGIPNDPRNFVETSGIRIGTAAETTRGHGADWFRDLTKRIIDILS